MNFFAHYYFHQRPTNSWYNAGLLFPDLLRNFTAKQRLQPSKLLISLNQTPEDDNLIAGINQHFMADHLFHNWDWFIKKNKDLAQTIRNSGLGIKRDWFMAHIMIELAIDHLLVCQNESMVHQLYSDLEACDTKWKSFFDKQSLGELKSWNEGMSKFRTSQYIFSYHDTDNLNYALNRIYQTTRIGTLNDIQNRFLVVILNDLIPEIKPILSKLHKILK